MAPQAFSNALHLALRLFDEAFDGPAWHGPNLRGAVRKITPAEAAWRPGPGMHNIWEIVVHAAYWKYAVRRRLLGERRRYFPFKGSNWFGLPTSLTEDAWASDLALLDRCHSELRKVIENLSPTHLNKPARGSRQITGRIMLGIAAHDVYHAGQIQLLKRLQAETKRR